MFTKEIETNNKLNQLRKILEVFLIMTNKDITLSSVLIRNLKENMMKSRMIVKLIKKEIRQGNIIKEMEIKKNPNNNTQKMKTAKVKIL